MGSVAAAGVLTRRCYCSDYRLNDVQPHMLTSEQIPQGQQHCRPCQCQPFQTPQPDREQVREVAVIRFARERRRIVRLRQRRPEVWGEAVGFGPQGVTGPLRRARRTPVRSG